MANDILVGDGIGNFLHPGKSKISIFVTDGNEGLSGVVLTTEQLDDIILNLGRLRAEMLPPVTKKLEPNPVFRDVTRETIFHIDREHVVSREFFLAVRHPGFGWLAFPMKAEAGVLLSSMIRRQVEAVTPKIRPPGLI